MLTRLYSMTVYSNAIDSNNRVLLHTCVVRKPQPGTSTPFLQTLGRAVGTGTGFDGPVEIENPDRWLGVGLAFLTMFSRNGFVVADSGSPTARMKLYSPALWCPFNATQYNSGHGNMSHNISWCNIFIVILV